MLRLRRVSPNYRELFVARYDQLLAWALQISQGDRALAEDLLHDLYVLFTIHEPEIDPAQNVDGYLYTCLRNLYLSQIRRTARSRFQQLSIIEYESAKTGLRATDWRAQIEVQDELRRICQYACARKNTSRAGSVLILRFFHGYYPSEITQVLRSSRKAIDDRLRIARAEARTYLDDPQSLSFVGGLNLPEIFPANFARTSADLLGELRQMIFSSRQGECLASEHLQSFYQVNRATAMDCAELAHLVSCAVCLDEVNRMLKLPPLSQRYLSDTSGKDPGGQSGDGGGASGGPPRSLSKSRKARRLIASGRLNEWDEDAREAFEHKPQELCVAVNGYLLGTQKVGQEQNELTLSLNSEEKPSFIEVFSEQGIRLSLMSVGDPPPEGVGEQRLQVRLSDTRALDLTLHFTTPFLTLHVTYTDPALKGATALEAEVASENSAGLPLAVQPVRRKLQTERKRFSTLIKFLRTRSFGSQFWLRPATLTALFALLLIASLLLYLRAPTPLPTASDLLSRAAIAEQALSTQTDTVLHRTINLEEKNARGELIAKHKLEVWQSAERGVTARRLYNEQGQLVAGDWRRQDGVQTLYQHGARPQIQLTPEQRNDVGNVLAFNHVWQLSLSAKEFSELIGEAKGAHVQERENIYVIAYEGTRGVTSSTSTKASLVRASVILNRADLRPIEQTLVISQGEETREYRFVETNYERRAPNGVAPSVFEPESELLSEKPKTETGKSKESSSSVSPAPLSPSVVAASPELEVEVLRLVHQTGADLGDQVSVRRSADGRLEVQGIVETEDRKNEIIQTLAPAADNPAVRIKVETVAEALKQQAKSQAPLGPATVERLESANSKIPVDAELRRYFSGQGLNGAELDQRVNEFARQIENRSFQLLRQAGALQRLTQRFSVEQLRTLNPDARSKWLTLLREHAQAVQRELTGIRQELRPFSDSASTAGSQEFSKIETDRDLQQAANRLFELCSATDQALRSAFTISPNSSNAAAIKSPQFWGLLKSAESLTTQIGKR